MSKPIRIFSSYSSADEVFRQEFEAHLAVLKRAGLIETWNFRQIEAGDDWKQTIDAKLNEAAIILLFVSASFLASDYCWEVEMKRALERHDRGEAVVVPIILRDCDWHAAPFAKLQALPEGGKAVSRWRPRDRAWSNVVAGIRKRIGSLPARESAKQSASLPAHAEALRSELAVIDAAPQPVDPSRQEIVGSDQVLSRVEPVRQETAPMEGDIDRALLMSFDGHGTSFVPLREARTGDALVLLLTPASPQQSAFLDKLRRNRQAQVGVSFGLTAILGRLQEATQYYQDGKETWRVTLHEDQTDYGAGFMEMSTSGYSADEIATLRARRILLNERRAGNPGDIARMLNDTTLEVLIRGMNTPLEVTASPLPALFADGGDQTAFIAAARLLLVLYLRLAGVVEHIFKLDLRLESAARLHVDFEGQRARKYTNVEPTKVIVRGVCDLSEREAG